MCCNQGAYSLILCNWVSASPEAFMHMQIFQNSATTLAGERSDCCWKNSWKNSWKSWEGGYRGLIGLTGERLCLVVVVQLLSRVRLFTTPWAAARQSSLSLTISRSLPKFMSIESVMPSSHLILCRPLLLLPSIFPSIGVFFSESALHIRWPSIGVSASASVLPKRHGSQPHWVTRAPSAQGSALWRGLFGFAGSRGRGRAQCFSSGQGSKFSRREGHPHTPT